MASDDKMVEHTSNREPGSEGLREGASGAPEATEPAGQDPDMGADMSDTGGAQWDSVIKAGGIQNEPGLEGLQRGAGDGGQ